MPRVVEDHHSAATYRFSDSPRHFRVETAAISTLRAHSSPADGEAPHSTHEDSSALTFFFDSDSENHDGSRLNSLRRTRVSDSGTSGLGTFATVDIEQGGLIMRETPLILYPQVIPFRSDLAPERAYPDLEHAVHSLSTTNREAFFDLMNSHLTEPSRVRGIIDTNALDIGHLPGTPCEYAAICKDISRVNHSCSPNAVYCFDIVTVSVELRALFPIPAGSQIVISYIDPALPLADRQRALASYSFTCACSACSLTGSALPQSENRRSLIARADSDVDARNAALERWARTASMPDDYIIRIDKMYMDLFAKEQLYYEPVWEAYATRLCKACCALEDVEGARKWARLAEVLNRAYTGHDRGWASVVAAPERTDWWGLRRKASSSGGDDC
ncbi:hypothetical protein C8Q80DRAFT_1124948 [Daedaleopsis nitida]|nr:hypothetical protein C8Q80DRAFT_1124948 [Daedaleopsis nitida]